MDTAPVDTAPDAPPRPDGPLPPTAVTCLEDRALVRRTTDVTLRRGTTRLLLGPVTPLAADRTLRAEITGPAPAGAAVVDIRPVRARTPRPPGDPGEDATALRRRVHGLTEELRAGRHREQRLAARLDTLGQARADLLREIAEAAGWGDAEPERWSRRLAEVEERRATDAERYRLHRLRLDGLHAEHAEAERALREAEQRPPEITALVEVVLTADEPGRGELTVSHLVPCALWRPAYRAVLDEAGAAVRLECDAVVWQRTGEDWAGVRADFSTARSALAAEPPALTEDVLVLRERDAEERHEVHVDVREEEVGTVGEDSPQAAPAGPDRLPGPDDGGEARHLTAPARVSVPADGRAHRVPLSAFDAPATVERACAPELSPLVQTVAAFPNRGTHVLLAGPVDLVRGSGYTGRGTLRFTGTGAEARLSFGSEDTLRVVRHTEERREPSRLPGGRTTAVRTVRLFASRLDGPAAPSGGQPGREAGAAVRLVLRERIPVPEVSAVQVRLVREACEPVPDAVDADGIVRWDLLLEPAERRTVRLVYEIAASSRVAGL